MSASLAILTIGIVPMQEVLPLLTEYIDEDNISHHSLLGKLSREEVMAEYAPEAGEDTILTLLNDNQLAHVSRRKVGVTCKVWLKYSIIGVTTSLY